MADIHDYLEDQMRDIANDMTRALRRARSLQSRINAVSDFGAALRLDVFSVTQQLENALSQVDESKRRIDADRAANPKETRRR